MLDKNLVREKCFLLTAQLGICQSFASLFIILLNMTGVIITWVEVLQRVGEFHSAWRVVT